MNQHPNYIFNEGNIDWKRLEGIGISREQLEKDGGLDQLLQGKETELIPVRLKTSAIDLTLDATLRLATDGEGKTIMEINGIRPAK